MLRKTKTVPGVVVVNAMLPAPSPNSMLRKDVAHEHANPTPNIELGVGDGGGGGSLGCTLYHFINKHGNAGNIEPFAAHA